MKKKLALLLAGVMALSMVPMTAFAKSTNRVTNVVVESVDTVLTVGNAPELKLYGDDLDSATTEAFRLDLTNATWEVAALKAALPTYEITKLTNKSIVVEAMPTASVDGKDAFVIPMLTELTAKGDATVTVIPRESVLSAGEYKFATVTSGEVAVSIEGIKSIAEKNYTTALKTIVLEETVAGTIEDGELKLRLTKDWEFEAPGTPVVYPSGAATVVYNAAESDGRDLVFDVTVTPGNTEEIIITLAPVVSWDYDEVEAGEICEMTVSGAGVDKTTLEVAKAISYGVTWTAEDKALPEIYWGTTGETLDVTLEETIPNSWLVNRTTKIVFNEEVKVLGVTIEDIDGTSYAGDAFKVSKNELTFGDWTTAGTADVTFAFEVSVKPGFTGDITATLTGKGVEEDMEVVVATAVAPVTVEAEQTDVVLDYRHTEIGDITITEAETGLLADGSVIVLALEKLMFDDEPDVEVVAGDLTIDDTWVTDGKIYIQIDDESVKEAATIKVTGATLYMERNIPAGDYSLKLSAYDTIDAATESALAWDGLAWDEVDVSTSDDVLFQNNAKDGDAYLWDKGSVLIADDYVSVVTAGRDVDDSTFTTTLEVTVGATEMKANDKAITLDVPAYISGGYTMLPVRAITEALSGTAIVRWDDVAKQVTITFGSRVIAMTVGSDVMTINGVEVPMLAKCEITDSRAFIPLRDMGYALGLNDAAINWNAETNTATLN